MKEIGEKSGQISKILGKRSVIFKNILEKFLNLRKTSFQENFKENFFLIWKNFNGFQKTLPNLKNILKEF